jgi:Flp pilus assembly protein TadG
MRADAFPAKNEDQYRQSQEGTAGRRGLAASLRLFRHDRSGASALEFAIVATPVILLLLAILEVGLVFFANFTLENATAQGARMIRTGQAQAQHFDAPKFKAEVCKHLSAPISCAGLKLDVRHFSNFSSSALTDPLDSSGNLKANFTYDPGEGEDVVVVRSFYEWPLAAKLPAGVGLSNMANGNRLLSATQAFRNEPFKN